MTTNKTYRFRHQEGESGAYLELFDHPHVLGVVKIARTINIHEIVPGYTGPWIHLDLNEAGRPIGIEIVYFGPDAADADIDEEDGH